LMMALERCPMEWSNFPVRSSIDVGMSIKK